MTGSAISHSIEKNINHDKIRETRMTDFYIKTDARLLMSCVFVNSSLEFSQLISKTFKCILYRSKFRGAFDIK